MTSATDRDHAKQLEMLAIDERYADRWIATMRELVTSELGNTEFVARRMDALHEWERSRKREQHNLHFKYDPLHRNPRLVDRDVKRQTENLEEQIATLTRKLEEQRAAWDARKAERDAARVKPTRPPAQRMVPVVRRAPTGSVVRSLEGIPQAVIDVVGSDSAISELQYATDADVRQALLVNVAGISEEGIQEYLDMLNGIHPNWPREQVHQ